MIPAPVGWRLERLPRGLVYIHPRGRSAGAIFYRERVHPLKRLVLLVNEILAATPGFTVVKMGSPERLLTFDGEHAALVTVLGQQGGRPAQRDLGFVFADDFYSTTGGLCLETELCADFTTLVRGLVRHDVHALGVRRRRYDYAPPPGWQPLAQGLAVEWIPPEYPKASTLIKVYPAAPKAIVGAVGPDKFLATLEEHGYVASEKKERVEVRSQSGIAGWSQELTLTRAGEPQLLQEIVVLDDARYGYPLELSSHDPARWAEHRAVFDRIVKSIEPVPAASLSEAAAGVLSHWLG